MLLEALALAGLLVNVAVASQAQLALHRDAHPIFSELRHPQFVVAFSRKCKCAD